MHDTDTLERASIEAEQVVLGGLLANERLFDQWQMAEHHFAEPFHREIFRLISSAHGEGRGINAKMLAAKVQHAAPITENCSAAEYVRRLEVKGIADLTPGAADDLKDIANRRHVMAIGRAMSSAGADHETDIRGFLADVIAEIDGVLVEGRETKTYATYSQAIRDAVAELRNPTPAQRATTGLKTLDASIGGYHRGQFCILAGRPSMGKSMIGLASLVRTAHARHGTVLFSLEMGRHELACRSMSDIAWTSDRPIPYTWALNGSLTDDQFERWQTAAAKFETIPLVIDDQRSLTVSEIAARARKHKKQFETDGGSLDLIVVDHMGLIKPSGRYAGNKVNEVGEISNGLATLAKELDCCVLAMQQLNRGVEGRENKRPGLSDLRNSGDIEQDAHVVMFAYRESYYLERMKHDAGTQQELERQAHLEAVRNAAEIIVAKNRNGPTEIVHVYCDPACNVVRDLA